MINRIDYYARNPKLIDRAVELCLETGGRLDAQGRTLDREHAFGHRHRLALELQRVRVERLRHQRPLSEKQEVT